MTWLLKNKDADPVIHIGNELHKASRHLMDYVNMSVNYPSMGYYSYEEAISTCSEGYKQDTRNGVIQNAHQYYYAVSNIIDILDKVVLSSIPDNHVD